MGIARKCTSTMYRSGGWWTGIEIWVVSRSCVYRGQRTHPLNNGTQQPIFLEYQTFLRFGTLSLACSIPVSDLVSFSVPFPVSDPIPFSVLFLVSDSIWFPVLFHVSDSVSFPILFPVSNSVLVPVPFLVPFHISDSIPRSSIPDRLLFWFPFRIPFAPRLPCGSAYHCFSLCSRAALLYIEGSA